MITSNYDSQAEEKKNNHNKNAQAFKTTVGLNLNLNELSRALELKLNGHKCLKSKVNKNNSFTPRPRCSR